MSFEINFIQFTSQFQALVAVLLLLHLLLQVVATALPATRVPVKLATPAPTVKVSAP